MYIGYMTVRRASDEDTVSHGNRFDSESTLTHQNGSARIGENLLRCLDCHEFPYAAWPKLFKLDGDFFTLKCDRPSFRYSVDVFGVSVWFTAENNEIFTRLNSPDASAFHLFAAAW